jgi:hypothetical protein
MKTIAVLILINTSLFAQPWDYDFGTGTGSFSIPGESTTFLPTPPSGIARIRIGSQGGSFNLENPGVIGFGSNTELRAVAPTGGSLNKYSMQNYSTGKSFTIKFDLRIDGGSSGTWYFFQGSGSSFTSNTGFAGADVFTGIRWILGTVGSISSSYRTSGAWTSFIGTPFAQANNYTIEIYGNNTTSTQNYTYGTAQSVAVDNWDLWINGVLVGDNLSKAGLSPNTDIDSYMFYGESSVGNVANIFLDNIVYTNTIASTPLPVELSSFSAIVLDNAVKLNWRTETEVSNYGFEVERLQDYNIEKLQDWKKIGFVQGHGNSNSPKDYFFIDDLSFTPNLTHTLNYRLKQFDTDGKFEYSKVIEVDFGSPTKFELSQNYPNPFNPVTTIRFSLPQSANVKLTVHNLLGEEIATLVNEFKEVGVYIVNFNATELNSGIYIYKIEADGFVQSGKMALIK